MSDIEAVLSPIWLGKAETANRSHARIASDGEELYSHCRAV
jgi:hypothetical protein